MKDKLFQEFCRTGKIIDYLKYREEVSRELSIDERRKKTRRNNPSDHRLSRKS